MNKFYLIFQLWHGSLLETVGIYLWQFSHLKKIYDNHLQLPCDDNICNADDFQGNNIDDTEE